MLYLKIIIALVFLAFAILQYNDPDPLHWMVWYGGVALLTGLSLRYPSQALLSIGFAVYFCHFLYLIPPLDQIGYGMEATWECLGTLMATLWLGVLMLKSNCAD